jgi:pilus assembly protein CpaF
MSLLKRIEQGHGSNSPAGPGDADKSRLLAMQARRVAPPGVSAQKDTYLDLKTRVQNRLFAELDPTMDVTAVNEVRATILELFEQVLSEESTVLSRP